MYPGLFNSSFVPPPVEIPVFIDPLHLTYNVTSGIMMPWLLVRRSSPVTDQTTLITYAL